MLERDEVTEEIITLLRKFIDVKGEGEEFRSLRSKLKDRLLYRDMIDAR